MGECCLRMQSGDEGVALESCEFWSAFCEAAVAEPDRISPDVLRPFLGRLIPVLLKNMVRAHSQHPPPSRPWPAGLSCLQADTQALLTSTPASVTACTSRLGAAPSEGGTRCLQGMMPQRALLAHRWHVCGCNAL